MFLRCRRLSLAFRSLLLLTACAGCSVSGDPDPSLPQGPAMAPHTIEPASAKLRTDETTEGAATIASGTVATLLWRAEGKNGPAFLCGTLPLGVSAGVMVLLTLFCGGYLLRERLRARGNGDGSPD